MTTEEFQCRGAEIQYSGITTGKLKMEIYIYACNLHTLYTCFIFFKKQWMQFIYSINFIRFAQRGTTHTHTNYRECDLVCENLMRDAGRVKVLILYSWCSCCREELRRRRRGNVDIYLLHTHTHTHTHTDQHPQHPQHSDAHHMLKFQERQMMQLFTGKVQC